MAASGQFWNGNEPLHISTDLMKFSTFHSSQLKKLDPTVVRNTCDFIHLKHLLSSANSKTKDETTV